VLAVFSTLLRNNLPINIFEDGNESRDFVYISDVVSAIMFAIEKEEADFSVFNVGTGVPTRILDIADILKNSLKSGSVIKVSGNYRLGDIRHNAADTTRIQTMLNFTPKVTLSEGLSLFAKWALSQDNSGGEGFLKSINELKERNLFK
jgi:dTDP-L-rhamnose 4-epimerase